MQLNLIILLSLCLTAQSDPTAPPPVAPLHSSSTMPAPVPFPPAEVPLSSIIDASNPLIAPLSSSHLPQNDATVSALNAEAFTSSPAPAPLPSSSSASLNSQHTDDLSLVAPPPPRKRSKWENQAAEEDELAIKIKKKAKLAAQERRRREKSMEEKERKERVGTFKDARLRPDYVSSCPQICCGLRRRMRMHEASINTVPTYHHTVQVTSSLIPRSRLTFLWCFFFLVSARGSHSSTRSIRINCSSSFLRSFSRAFTSSIWWFLPAFLPSIIASSSTSDHSSAFPVHSCSLSASSNPILSLRLRVRTAQPHRRRLLRCRFPCQRKANG